MGSYSHDAERFSASWRCSRTMDSHFASSSVMWGAVVVANQFYCRGLERLWLVRPDIDVKFCGADVAGSSVSGKNVILRLYLGSIVAW